MCPVGPKKLPAQPDILAVGEFFRKLLKRWAKFGRPSGAGLSGISFRRIAQERVLTHTLKRCATQNQERNRVLPQPVKALSSRSTCGTPRDTLIKHHRKP